MLPPYFFLSKNSTCNAVCFRLELIMIKMICFLIEVQLICRFCSYCFFLYFFSYSLKNPRYLSSTMHCSKYNQPYQNSYPLLKIVYMLRLTLLLEDYFYEQLMALYRQHLLENRKKKYQIIIIMHCLVFMSPLDQSLKTISISDPEN